MTESELGPTWTEEQMQAGKKNKERWESFFSSAETPDDISETPLSSEEAGRIGDVLRRHEDELMRFANVVGVSQGVRTEQGIPTGEPAIIVYVSKKVPESELEADQVLPKEIEGIRVDVVQSGEIKAL